MIAPFLFLALVLGGPAPLPPFSSALGRPLAWDPYGAYGLDAEGPLSKPDTEILSQIAAGELGRAEVLCRERLAPDGADVVPAWLLGQILRVKHSALLEYRRAVAGKADTPAPPGVLLYRLQVCRLALAETLVPLKNPDMELRRRLSKEMKSLRDLCRPYAAHSLGLAIGISQVDPFWALTNRSVLEAYRTANPKGVDVRPLICQAYNTGVSYGLAVFPDGHREKLAHEDEPQPKKALEIALSILKDRPNDPLGHFHAGRSYARMELPQTAQKEFRAALAAGGLPPLYEAAAKQYLDSPTQDAFRPPVAY